MEKFKTIYADPPWMERGGIKKSASKHYRLMTTASIAAIRVKEMMDSNAHLYLWTTNNFLRDALTVMEAWGFRYVTMITWAKTRFGIGQYFRGQTEHCLFGVRGRLPYKIIDGKRCQGRTLLNTDKTFERTRRHSEKPESMRRMIEVVSWPPYLELFARKAVNGWTCKGLEADGTTL